MERPRGSSNRNAPVMNNAGPSYGREQGVGGRQLSTGRAATKSSNSQASRSAVASRSGTIGSGAFGRPQAAQDPASARGRDSSSLALTNRDIFGANAQRNSISNHAAHLSERPGGHVSHRDTVESRLGPSYFSASSPQTQRQKRSEIPRTTFVKSSQLKPAWQIDDFSPRSKTSRKRHDEGVEMTFSTRRSISSISGPRRAVALPSRSPSIYGKEGKPAILGPNLTLREIKEHENETDVVHRPQKTTRELVAGKAARKLQVAVKSMSARNVPLAREAGSSDESEESEESPESESEDRQSSRGSVASLDDNRLEDTRYVQINADLDFKTYPAVPSEELMQAIEGLTLSLARQQISSRLPFLRRNLRRGFHNWCHLAGIRVKPSDRPVGYISVIYKQSFGDSANTMQPEDDYEARMTDWLCPLCDLHGIFSTKEMMLKHIELDHHEVDVDFLTPSKVIVKIPQVIAEEDMMKFPALERGRSVSPRERDMSLDVDWSEHPASLAAEAPIVQEFVSGGIENFTESKPARRTSTPGDLTPARLPSEASTLRDRSSSYAETPVIPKSKLFVPSPPRSSTQPSIPDRYRSLTYGTPFRTSRASSARGSLPSRYPSPPPPSDPLGPAAQPPYLPATSEHGAMHFSCRPGGPRLYDLLGTLPLEPYGVLAWSILDKEEEIFELDDVRDEDKVIQILWNRWISLHLNKFVEDYYQGTIAFIDEYWRMIHRAAGWASLRSWLLMLVVNRFLTGSEMARILRHFGTLTGMDEWYT